MTCQSEEVKNDAPKGTREVVTVVWAGGVKPGPWEDDASHCRIDSVTTAAVAASSVALDDLGDGDSYVHLRSASAAIHVGATGGVSVEPGGDLNTGSTLDVTR